MSRILKNNTATLIAISDTGLQIPANGQITIERTDLELFSASLEIVPLISGGDVTVNFLGADLGPADGLFLIQELFLKDDKNVDGGFPSDVYLPTQNIDGGTP